MRPPADRVGVYKLASALLTYPTLSLIAGVDELDAAAAATPRASREPFERFLAWLRSTRPTEVAEHYVATFDLRRRCALYLTYYRHGDTRMRGMSLLEFKTAYRTAGFEPATTELPDYLPLVLEFADLHPRGEALLRRHRADLELLHRALASTDTPYVEVIEAVAARLPALSRRERVLVGRAWEAGPPRDDVGLATTMPDELSAPFAPPEYLSGSSDSGAGVRTALPIVESVTSSREGRE
ncbi:MULTISPECIES: nitrate reductase molybdenum cofactor assembly chaperone [Nocardia]|uniref:Nitrate reductase molybdenum cofactor assembly chaperone n=2 Tax=Nocardia TaxID=1817 RepID=A0A2T2ZB24_9NOCA|nr:MULTISPECIES: nitrate reductase molybdenum cofactor assembly chaperone [Nocardia]PSR64961.1 nitrate reductase molybdenum cofactor assembly chaperone [Nocardia nova]